MRPTLAQRICRKIRLPLEPQGCWEWTAAKLPEGYGIIHDRAYGCRAAHRAAYELLVGPIPAGLQLDHLCRNRSCVNPDHLEPVTAKENFLRSESPLVAHSRKTHCKRGHPFDEENTRRHRLGRECKRCNADRKRAQYLKKRSARSGS